MSRTSQTELFILVCTSAVARGPLVLPKTLSRLTYFYDPLMMFLYDKKGQCLCYSPDFMSR